MKLCPITEKRFSHKFYPGSKSALTYNTHVEREHQRYSDGKADNIEGHKVANGSNLLLPCSPDNGSRHTLMKFQEKVFGLLLALQEG